MVESSNIAPKAQDGIAIEKRFLILSPSPERDSPISLVAKQFGFLSLEAADTCRPKELLIHSNNTATALEWVSNQDQPKADRIILLCDEQPSLAELIRIGQKCDHLVASIRPAATCRLRTLLQQCSDNERCKGWINFRRSSLRSTHSNQSLTASSIISRTPQTTPLQAESKELVSELGSDEFQALKIDADDWLAFIQSLHVDDLYPVAIRLLPFPQNEISTNLDRACENATPPTIREKNGLVLRNKITSTLIQNGYVQLAKQVLLSADPLSSQAFDVSTAQYINLLLATRALNEADQVYQYFSQQIQVEAGIKSRWAILKICVGQLDAARKLLKEDLDENGPNASYQYWFARLERLSGNTNNAISLLENLANQEAISDNLRSNFLFELGLAYADLENYDGARNAFQKAIELPIRKPAWIGMLHFELAAISLVEGAHEKVHTLALSGIAATSDAWPRFPNPCILLCRGEDKRKWLQAIEFFGRSWSLPQFPYDRWAQLVLGPRNNVSSLMDRPLTPHESKLASAINNYLKQ